jgi:hypothetical protein
MTPEVLESGTRERVGCMACDHSADQHDPIARRYCEATIAHAFTRRCICSVPA